MVVSLDPRYSSFKRQPGHRYTDYDIGGLAVAALARSVERYQAQFSVHRTVSAVEELLRAAKHRARQTGQSVSQVLKEHQAALEAQTGNSQFLLSTSNYGGQTERGQAVRDAMLLQDDRRRQHEFSALTTAAARAVDAAENSRMLVPYVEREELRVPQASTSVMRLPAAADSMGGDTPNADRLRIMGPPAEPRERQRPLRLRDDRAGGGGFHNPIMF